MKYYKFLTADNKGEYSKFDYTEYLPDGDKPGKWLPEIETLSICESGYHACKASNLLKCLVWSHPMGYKPMIGNANLYRIYGDKGFMSWSDKLTEFEQAETIIRRLMEVVR